MIDTQRAVAGKRERADLRAKREGQEKGNVLSDPLQKLEILQVGGRFAVARRNLLHADEVERPGDVERRGLDRLLRRLPAYRACVDREIEQQTDPQADRRIVEVSRLGPVNPRPGRTGELKSAPVGLYALSPWL